MSDFKSRLEEERQQLSERLSKLNVFMQSENFKNIDPKQQDLLTLQATYMHQYELVLAQRLQLLN